jgi:citrate synthase
VATSDRMTARTDDTSASVTIGDKTYDVDVLRPVLGSPALNLTSVTKDGYAVYDPGLARTAVCQSGITYVDGENGVLLYRGYPVQELAKAHSFLESAYLLIYGELPTPEERQSFEKAVFDSDLASNPSVGKFFDAFPRGTHPMAMLSSIVSGLSCVSDKGHKPGDAEGVVEAGAQLLGAMPVFAAHAFSTTTGAPRVASQPELGYAENFLNMCFPGTEHDPLVVECLETLLVLHADHEQNCSTATLRLVASSHANFLSGVSAAISALWGPLHGGANQAVLQMLSEIHEDSDDVSKYIRRAKDSSDPFKLMGFGHRVYKTVDARAKMIRSTAIDLLTKIAKNDPLLDLALQLEEIAREDDYFVSRRLYPNIDFYSGLIYRAIGFPPEMFTPLFVVGRVPGWIAHWRELQLDPQRIGRPTQLYVGSAQRDLPSKG